MKIRDSLEQIASTQNDTSKIHSYSQFAWILRDSDPEFALNFAFKALDLIKKTQKKNYLAHLYNFIGVIYRNVGNYSISQGYYIKAMESAEAFNDSLEIGYALNNIGDMFILTRNYSEAERYLKDAEKIFLKLNNKKAMGYASNKLALVYYGIKNYDLAISYQLKSIKIREEIKSTDALITALRGLGDIYLELKNYDSCYYYYTRVAKEGEKFPSNKIGKAELLVSFGNYYLKLKMLDSAIYNYKKAIETSYEISYWQTIELCSQQLGKIYFEMGDFKSAYTYNALFQKANDTLMNESSVRGVYEVLAKYKEKKEKELSDKIERNNGIIRNSSIGAFLVALLLLFIFLMINRKMRLQNKLLEEQKTAIALQHDEIKSHSASKDKLYRIMAHDLKNPFMALNNIPDLILDDWDRMDEIEKKRMLEIMKKSANRTYALLEDLLTWARADSGKMPFEPQITNITFLVANVIKLHSEFAKQKQISLTSFLPEKLDVFCDQNMLNTVFRNLIGNAIKFTQSGGAISIGHIIKEKEIQFLVKDSGVGIDPVNMEKIFRLDSVFTTEGTNEEYGSGLGLIVCKEFIEKNGGKIWAESTFGEGANFFFTLPLATILS